jgi:glycosyltransferase involved in cell wall biosynthesis
MSQKQTKNPIKIALLSSVIYPSPPKNYGGLERIVYDLADQLYKKGHDVTLYAPKGTTSTGFKVVKTVNPSSTIGNEEIAYQILKPKIETYDIIHDHSHLHWSYMYKANVNPDIKVIGTWHSLADHREPPPVQYPNIVSISKVHAELTSRQLGVHSKVVYNGFNPDDFAYSEEKKNFYIFMSRIARFKGAHEAIQIAREKRIPLFVAGEDRFVQDPNYVTRVRESCKGMITYLGCISNKKRMELLRDAKCMLFPLMWSEPFGMVVIEANFSGTPVITMRRGAMPELVRHNKSGYLCNDLDEFHKYIDKIEAGEIKSEDCRKNAMRFTASKMADDYIKLYKQILKGAEW